MKQFIYYLLTNILPEETVITITEIEEEGDVVRLKVEIPEELRGVVIGKSGMNIKSIRNLVGIIARRENKRVEIDIVD
jgi:predicted RNA-binding protein YlqC (UPF0109 family)